MVSGGQRIPRVTSAPLLSSERSGWSGLRMERHRMERAGDGAGVIDGHQICYNLTGPVPMRWQLTGRWLNGTLNKGDLCFGDARRVFGVCHGIAATVCCCFLFRRAYFRKRTGERGRAVELESRRGFRDPHIESICRMLHADLTAGTPAGPLYGEQLGSALAIYLTRQTGSAEAAAAWEHTVQTAWTAA